MVFKSNFPPVTPDPKYKDLVSNFFWSQLDVFGSRVLFVDYETGRQWTGGQIKAQSARTALSLQRHGFEKDSNCVMFYKHSDYIQLVALGVLFAGGSVCVGFDSDPAQEHAYMLGAIQPAFVFVKHELVGETLQTRCDKLDSLRPFTLVIMDDDALSESEFQRLVGEGRSCPRATTILGLHHDLWSAPGDATPTLEPNQNRGLPMQVDPLRPAFVLLTSGSTGRPKPGCRSQRNSLYVAHSLVGAEQLWDLNESSVVAAHLPLDHGTGIFLLKQCLARGFKSVIINGYQMDSMLYAIEKHRITDLVLGSALLHNMLSSQEVSQMMDSDGETLRSRLGSLRNFLAVGSSIALQSLVAKFMRCLPECSVRQAFGMTECGFLCVVPRAMASAEREPLDLKIVGRLLPNVEIKLVERQSGEPVDQAQQANGDDGREKLREISQRNTPGELYVRGPTVSPGYLGEQFREQARKCFLPDGFYKSNDICSFGDDQLLRMFGRFNDVLCLSDGWKVLPSEIEQVILELPLVKEVAVVGIAHPRLPTCHAPRAYIVPKDGVKVVESSDEGEEFQSQVSNGNWDLKQREHNNNQHTMAPAPVGEQTLTKRMVFEFAAARLSEPKHLVGGIKFMQQLPKISTLGKVDRKALKKMDGLV